MGGGGERNSRRPFRLEHNKEGKVEAELEEDVFLSLSVEGGEKERDFSEASWRQRQSTNE